MIMLEDLMSVERVEQVFLFKVAEGYLGRWDFWCGCMVSG